MEVIEGLVVVLVVVPLTVIWVCASFAIRVALAMPRLAVALFWFAVTMAQGPFESAVWFFATCFEVTVCTLMGDLNYC